MKRARLLLCVVLFLIVLTTSWAQDLSGLYDGSTLKYWRRKYKPNIRWNFENVVWTALSPQEQLILQEVSLAFPLVGLYGDPFSYSANVDRSIINMPVLSIKFLDDLSIAQVWLEENGYGYERVADYIAMLKYKERYEFLGGDYPPPLIAFGIPTDALKYGTVDETSQKILKSAVIWIMTHEIGHIHYGHPSYGAVSAAQARRNEAEADRFATEIMRRIGVVPAGLGMFFTAVVIWSHNRGDYATDAEWDEYLRTTTHPVTSNRLANLADLIELWEEDFVRKEPNRIAALVATRAVVKELRGLAYILSDPRVQMIFRARVEASDPSSLAIR